MKKSLILTSYFPPMTGGISKSLYNFYLNFPQDKIAVLTDQKQSTEKPGNIYVKNFFCRIKIIWPKWIPMIFHTYKIVKENNIDLLQVGQVIPHGYAALFVKKLLKKPYIVYVYGQDLLINRPGSRKYRRIQKILNASDGIIANSSYTKKLMSDMGIKVKTTVAYPCPQINHISLNNDELKDFKAAHDLNGKKVVLSVGNLVERKGQDNVIQAVSSLRKKIPNLRYVIVGNGPARSKLSNLIKDRGLQGLVTIHQNVSDRELKNFYASAHVMAMPSRLLKDRLGQAKDVEGFGMVFLEANLFGLPVVGGNNGGQTDAIEDGKSGLIVDPTSIKEIEDALFRLLSDQSYAERLGEYGKKRVLEKFSWTEQAGKIINFIQDLG